jgi:hypothetical protein
MTDDFVKVAVPAALGLLGTLFGLWLGQIRWSSEQRLQKRRAFDAKRYAAYEELWNTVEGAHIALRVSAPTEDQLRELEQKINAFRLRNAIFLNPDDSGLASEYFTEIIELSKLVRNSGSPLLEREWSSTIIRATQETEFQESDKTRQLDLAAYRASNSRSRLLERIQSMMLETSYAASKSV